MDQWRMCKYVEHIELQGNSQERPVRRLHCKCSFSSRVYHLRGYCRIDKAERLIGYKPLVFFEEGFETNINWFKENWELIEKYADFPPGMSSAVKNVG